jgi:crotonobetainyl-CoA:carnitine CoA-transferase CaiB-like acyl-CoA transferase
LGGLLEGVRILDLSQMLSGPYTTMVLGDMGAEIIKIEEPGEGDRTRTMPHHHFGGLSGYYISINRNKKSVTLDLKVPEAREVFYDLVRKSDVVFDNFRPGVLERLKIDFETLRKIKKDIISVSITAYGYDGPYKDLPAFDLTIQAIGGAMSVTGEPGGAPVRLGLPMGDIAGAVFASNAVTAALFKKEKTGEGSRVDVSLLDALVSMHVYVAQYVLQGGEVPGPVGSGHQSVVPYRAFRGGDGEWFVIAVFTEKFWGLFCKMLGIEGLEKDPRFFDNPHRCVNREALFQILEEEFEKKPAAEWLKMLDKAGVPAAPINRLDRTLTDPQILQRKMVVEMEIPGSGKVKTMGNPVKVLGEHEHFAAPAQLGQHTEEVLHVLLGYPKEKIAHLREKKAI